MAIREITPGGGSIDPMREKKSQIPGKGKAAEGAKDRVQLSDEARSMYEAGQSRRLQDVEAKVASGYYFTPEATEKIVDGILKDLKRST